MELEQSIVINDIKNIEDIYLTIGTNIKKARKHRGMTQHQLAQMLNITFQQLQKYENGKNKVSAARLYQLSQQLELPLKYFFNSEKV
jgi:transcriptional regulator with XRE-family HTH domain